MNYPAKCWVIFLIAVIIALSFRLPRLEQRPMHTDEAVHAIKFGELFEEGLYHYDPQEYHGPTLNYFTLISAWLGSNEQLVDVSEFTLRIVPVFFGIILILLLLLLTDGLGISAVIIAAFLTAVSPAFVFYSRYYIQEMLFVCFSFGVIASGYRYFKSRDIKWALLTGLFLGLTHVTKETCIIVFGSMALSVVLVAIMNRKEQKESADIEKRINLRHVFAALITGFIVSGLFYSSFLSNPRGILDSFGSYSFYFNRAANNQLHIHPWYYYLKMLLYFRVGSGPVWSEGFIVVLAGFGFIFSMTKRYIRPFNHSLIRFFAFYTLIMTVAYSAIPYKSPWSMLGFLHGMILMAAVGMVVFIQIATTFWRKAVVWFVLIASIFSLAFQSYAGSFLFYADTRNPYVYAHTSKDIFTITEQINSISSVHPEGQGLYIQVICPDNDYWPLPWYLRKFTRVSYQNKVDENTPSAPVIIASPIVQGELMRKLYELPPPGKKNLYVPLFDSQVELRPQVELLGFITKELWDFFQESQAQTIQSDTR